VAELHWAIAMALVHDVRRAATTVVDDLTIVAQSSQSSPTAITSFNVTLQ
jgi:hypothetical protein